MNVKSGTLTSPTSTGSQAITGVGFQPKAIIFFYNFTTADGNAVNSYMGQGVVTGVSDRWALGIYAEDGNRRSSRYFKTDMCIGLPVSTGANAADVEIEAERIEDSEEELLKHMKH